MFSPRAIPERQRRGSRSADLAPEEFQPELGFPRSHVYQERRSTGPWAIEREPRWFQAKFHTATTGPLNCPTSQRPIPYLREKDLEIDVHLALGFGTLGAGCASRIYPSAPPGSGKGP